MTAMRRRTAVLLACSMLIVACGDGINEGIGEGRGTRGTIDGVPLAPPDTLAAPESTDPDPDATCLLYTSPSPRD